MKVRYPCFPKLTFDEVIFRSDTVINKNDTVVNKTDTVVVNKTDLLIYKNDTVIRKALGDLYMLISSSFICMLT